MSEYVIKASAGYVPVPVTDIGSAELDFTFVSFTSADIESGGTLQDPKKIWEGNNGYIHSYGSANNISLPVRSMFGSTAPFSGTVGPATSTQSIFMCGVLRTVNDEQWVYCYFIYANDESSAKAQLNRFAGEGTLLYSGLLENSEGMLDVATGWDETPSEDKDDINNLSPNGGEYADLGAFDDTDQMAEGGLPDPIVFEQDYNGLLTCYALFGSAFADFGKSVFQTSFWQSLMNKFSGLSDPLSMIIDCVELPIGNIGSPHVGAAPMALGGIDVTYYNGSNVYIENTWARRYYKTNCGSITLKEVWGSAKDYTDASISIYLPYCGVKELDPDIVLRNTLTLYVYVDLWNGDVLYLLHTSNTGFDKKYFAQEAVVYRWTGNCGKKIPIGKVDTSNAIMQVASGIATVGLGVAAGGALGGAMFGAGGSIGAGMIGSSVMGGVNQLADVAANGFKPVVQTSGGVGGSVGRMDYQYPYLIIKRGIPEYPNNWRAEIGAPQYQSYTVSDLTGTGYTLFSHIELGNMGSATEEEKSELERLLTTEGVIL